MHGDEQITMLMSSIAAEIVRQGIRLKSSTVLFEPRNAAPKPKTPKQNNTNVKANNAQPSDSPRLRITVYAAKMPQDIIEILIPRMIHRLILSQSEPPGLLQ
jgi:hypothetical protein